MSSSSRTGILAVVGSLLGLSTIAVSLRFYTRLQQDVRIRADDWTALGALVAYLGASICIFMMVHSRLLGYPGLDFNPTQLAGGSARLGHFEIAFDILSTLALAMIKMSALFFYRRIFCISRVSDAFQIVTAVSLAIVICWLICFQFLAGFQCGTHLSALWGSAGDYIKYCTVSIHYYYGIAISDFLLDIWILALPIPRILGLNTTLRQRLSTTGVFLLGFVGLGASIARIVICVQIEHGVYHNQERILTMSCYVGMLEAGISLVAVNLPSLWKLFTRILPEKAKENMSNLKAWSVSWQQYRYSKRPNSESMQSSYDGGQLDQTGSSMAPHKYGIRTTRTVEVELSER